MGFENFSEYPLSPKNTEIYFYIFQTTFPAGFNHLREKVERKLLMFQKIFYIICLSLKIIIMELKISKSKGIFRDMCITKSSQKIPTHYLVFYKTISKESTPL